MSYHSPQTTSRRRKTHVSQFLTQLDIRITSRHFQNSTPKKSTMKNYETWPPIHQLGRVLPKNNSELHSQQTTRLRNQTLCLRNLFSLKKISSPGVVSTVWTPWASPTKTGTGLSEWPKKHQKKQKRWGIFFSNPIRNVSERGNFL